MQPLQGPTHEYGLYKHPPLYEELGSSSVTVELGVGLLNKYLGLLEYESLVF